VKVNEMLWRPWRREMVASGSAGPPFKPAPTMLEQAIDACVNGFLITSARGPDYAIEYVNPAFCRMTGYDAPEVLGRSCALLWDGAEDQHGVREIVQATRMKREVHAVVRIFRKDGTPVWSEVYVAPVTDAAGQVSHYVVAQYDVTDSKEHETELLYRVSHDLLTGLANRQLLGDRLQQMIARAVREQDAIWVMFIDLDGFKAVNDNVGHRIGDEFLKTVAERLRGCVREVDTVARIHGDEFLIAFAEAGDPVLTNALVRRVMQRVAEPIRAGGHEFSIRCSAGIAKYPSDADSADQLIDCADMAMYKAKQLGRNNVQFFDPELNLIAQQRRRMESALAGARERGEFELYYQARFDLVTGLQVGMEAQLSWNSPEFGLLAADRFIPLAGESGLIVPLGAWLLRTACARAEAWRAAGLGALKMTVRLSARQLRQPDLADMIATILSETGLPPCQLELGLTETLLLDDAGRAPDLLERLRATGVRLLVDDFGSGQASLVTLTRFPVNAVRIDSALVRKITPRAQSGVIPAAIIAMARSLGLRVIGNGVETETQCQFLARHQCDEVQGIQLSPSQPPEAMEGLLHKRETLPARLSRGANLLRTTSPTEMTEGFDPVL
jgi:diguanylate cyclase (GGDEF)-like protein/PAS domain S-box-containing protein